MKTGLRNAFLLPLIAATCLADPITINLLPPGPGNPRNTEGSFARLKDGRILFMYSRLSSEGPADSGAVWFLQGPTRPLPVSALRLGAGWLDLP